MFWQHLGNYIHTAVDVLGCVSGICTCAYGIAVKFKAGDSRFGQAVSAIGVNVNKLRAALAAVDGEKP